MKIDKNALNLALVGKCMSLSDLRIAAGISGATLTRIKNDPNHTPSTKTIGKIACALGIKPEHIIKED